MGDHHPNVKMDMMKPMMHMWFYQSNELVLLFHHFGSKKDEAGKYYGLLFFTVVLCFLMEVLSEKRYQGLMRAMAQDGEVPILTKLKLTLSYLVSTILGYSIMLIVMSFNVGVFITTVLGLTLSKICMSKWRQSFEKSFAA